MGLPPTSKDLRSAQRKGSECVSSAIFLRASRKCFVFRRGGCHVICFLSEKSQGIVSDILSCSDRVAGQEDVISVRLFCSVMKEA